MIDQRHAAAGEAEMDLRAGGIRNGVDDVRRFAEVPQREIEIADEAVGGLPAMNANQPRLAELARVELLADQLPGGEIAIGIDNGEAKFRMDREISPARRGFGQKPIVPAKEHMFAGAQGKFDLSVRRIGKDNRLREVE